VRLGYARTLTIPPNVAHAGLFARLAARARERDRGLWRACSGV
jgi:micrococcal nuclease